MMNVFTELRRRNVFRVAGTYVVAAWFITQTSFTLEGVMNLPEWFDTLVFAVGVMGFPIALVLAWVFELTPDGFKRTESASGNSIDREMGKKIDIAILIGLIAIGALLLFGLVRGGGDRAPGLRVDGRSVAVLPFENRSPEASNAFFADGIHDELLTSLSRVSGLDVISRTSVMGYRNTDKRIPDIATELGAAAVLEGAVAKSGDRVRVTVQLIDGTDDTHIWAENYDRALSTDNLLDIQSEITAVISNALRDVLGDGTQASPARATGAAPDVAAYEAYLRGRLLTQPGEEKAEDLRQALVEYGRAVDIAPDYAAAHAGMARARLALYWFHGKDPQELEAAGAALDRAKALDPQAADTNIAEAFYHYWGLSDYRSANAAFDRTLEVAPGNVDAVAGKAFIVRRLGDFAKAADGLEKAHRLDPLSYYLIPELALTYAFIGQFDAAEALMEKAYRIDPDSLQGHGFGAAVAQFSGNADLAYARFAPLAVYAPHEMVNYAISTRDGAKVRAELARWPAEARETPDGRRRYLLSQLRAADLLGLSETQVASLKTDLRALYTDGLGWDDEIPDHYITIPAFLGERAAVERLAAAYGDRNADNSFQAFADYADIAESYVRLGETEKALDWLARMHAMTGPWIGRLLSVDPTLDGLRDHPRYHEMFG